MLSRKLDTLVKDFELPDALRSKVDNKMDPHMAFFPLFNHSIVVKQLKSTSILTSSSRL